MRLSIKTADAAQLPEHTVPETAEILPEQAGLVERVETKIEHLTHEDRTY